MNTFAFVLYLFFNDGTQHRIPVYQHLEPAVCAELLMKGTRKPLERFYQGTETVRTIALACEGEQPLQKGPRA